MFMTSIFTGAQFNGTDPDQERDPPPDPTPPAFPQHKPRSSRIWSEAEPPPHFRSYFSRVTKPTDILPAHLEALNIRYKDSYPPDTLIPLAPDGTSYLPPLTVDQSMTPASYADATRIDASKAARHKAFDECLAEVSVDNDTGYRIIKRNTKSGVKPPRLAKLRKFWEGLESMSQYWDTSRDHYYEGLPQHAPAHADPEKAHKRQRTDSSQPSPAVTVPIYHSETKLQASSDGTASQATSSAAPAHYEGLQKDSSDSERLSRSASASPEPRTCMRYKGYRTASGRDMPDQFRADTVRGLVEGVTYNFECRIEAPRVMPIVQMDKLNMPVRQTAQVFQISKARTKNRHANVRGPVLTIQARPETDFGASGFSDDYHIWRARLDIMRELGGLLQCAQERSRQGKTERSPGEGEWWTTKPRWGGGPGGETENQIGNSDSSTKDVLQMAEEMVSAARERTRVRKKKTPAMLWKELKPGSKSWDQKTDYEAIGKEPDSPYDEVFMVSSLNHHISILKLTVHQAYLQFLQTDVLPEPLPAEQDWCAPQLRRTQWYDLFDVEQRRQAFRGLWGVMAYLTRETGKPAQAGAEDPPEPQAA